MLVYPVVVNFSTKAQETMTSISGKHFSIDSDVLYCSHALPFRPYSTVQLLRGHVLGTARVLLMDCNAQSGVSQFTSFLKIAQLFSAL